MGFTFNSYNQFRTFANSNRILKNPPKIRPIIHQPDKLQDFLSADTIKDFNHFKEEKFSLNGFEFKKTEDYILIYRIVFDPETHFPSLKEYIRIDRNLYAQLSFDGNPISSPQWIMDTMLNLQDLAC